MIIVTAGVARKPGMSRDDLLGINLKVMKAVGEGIKANAPERVRHLHHQPARRDGVGAARIFRACRDHMVVGMAGVLDSVALQPFPRRGIRRCRSSDVTSFVLGGHGDTMVPVDFGIRPSRASRSPISSHMGMFEPRRRSTRSSSERARGGGEIVALLKTGSAYYAPATSGIAMAEAYLNDQKRLLPCAAYVEGKYGLDGLYVGVPVIIGAGGVEQIVEIALDDRDHVRRGICQLARDDAVERRLLAAEEEVAHRDPRDELVRRRYAAGRGPQARRVARVHRVRRRDERGEIRRESRLERDGPPRDGHAGVRAGAIVRTLGMPIAVSVPRRGRPATADVRSREAPCREHRSARKSTLDSRRIGRVSSRR